MPTQFNTKDSGRRAESLTAMTTHALQNDRFISARMHRKHRQKPGPNDTAVSVWGVKQAHGETEAQAKTFRQAIRLSWAAFFFFFFARRRSSPISSKRTVKARLWNKTLNTYLFVLGLKSSHVPLLILVCYCDYYYSGGQRYVSASAMLLSQSGGLCGPVRYIRAVEESEWAQFVATERAESALDTVL